MKALSVDQLSTQSMAEPLRDLRVQALLTVGACGLLARVVLAYWSSGSNDILGWNFFAQQIATHGIFYEYQHDRHFNHPPLMGWLARAILGMSEVLGVRFAFLFKLPMIVADALSAFMLWFVARRRSGVVAGALVFALYSWSPISILISAHHGNTDCICAALILLAAVLSEETRLRFLTGVALGAAINVKLIPILCVPALLCAGPRTVRAWLHFSAGLSLGALPFVPVLLHVGPEFYRNAIAYNSIADHWGFVHILRLSWSHPSLREVGVDSYEVFRKAGRYVILGAIAVSCGLSFLTRRANAYVLCALSLSIFLVFAPGFGVQYLVYVSPLLFVVSPWFGFAYSCVAGLFAGCVYFCFWNGSVPFHTQFTTLFPAPSHPFGVLAWGLLFGFVVVCIVDVFSARPRLRLR